jgi:uncharacterized protein YdeI (YjbR/CyaY-like superfamily)
MTPKFFPTPAAFRKWLEKNHQSETELFVGYYKVGTKKPSLTWSESVDQALCFGWIDSVRRSIDDESYCIRFTPRKPNSIWSDVNIKKVKVLTKSGFMTAVGQKAFNLRKETHSRIYAHETEPVSLSKEYVKLFKTHQDAWKYFNTQAATYQRGMTHWIMSGKQEKTRLSRLNQTIKISEEKKRMLWK